MNYLINIRDGHHIVTMLTDEQIDAVGRIGELVQDVFEEVKEFVTRVFEDIRNIIDSLPVETKEELLNG